MACSGTTYTYAQLEGLWIQAGGPKAVAPVAAAIAEAESSGCSGALNLTDNNGTQTSVGLWQVSNGTHSYPSSWLTAAGNASEAVAKYKAAGGFSPWGTFNSGAYKAYVNGSTTPDTSLPAAAAPSTAGGSATPAGGSPCLFGFPGFSIPVIGSVGSFCIFSKAEARGILGGLLMLAGGGLFAFGAVIMAAGAFQRAAPALAGAADAAAILPGGGAAAEGLTAAHRRATRSGAQVASERRGARVTAQRQEARTRRRTETAARQQQRTEDRAARRAAGSPASQRRAVSGQAPRRPRPAARPAPAAEHH